MSQRVLAVVGARPNFMKIKPVLDGLDRLGVESSLVHTGQHYDDRLSDVFFDELGIRRPDVHLGVGSGSHAEQTGAVMTGFERVVAAERPDLVVVVGDVNSTMACAVVAAKAGALVAHVEAGLRSRDWTMPEEVNRVVTDRVSDLLLAPSPDAVENLRAEGYRDDQVHLVGNVMIDTLLANLPRARSRPVLDGLGLEAGRFGLVTLHRPANVDDGDALARLLDSLTRISAEVPLVFPAHPRTRSKLPADLTDRVIVTEPFGYLDFIALQDAAAVVLTDSGGVQEETTVLGTPCLTLRDNTERPITITDGTNTLVGRDPTVIVETAIDRIRNGSPIRRPALWDGQAGERCARAVLDRLHAAPGLRPTDTGEGGPTEDGPVEDGHG